MPTKAQLQKRIQELEEENDQLQDQLDQIYDIVAPPEGQSERSKDGLAARGKTDTVHIRRT